MKKLLIITALLLTGAGCQTSTLQSQDSSPISIEDLVEPTAPLYEAFESNTNITVHLPKNWEVREPFALVDTVREHTEEIDLHFNTIDEDDPMDLVPLNGARVHIHITETDGVFSSLLQGDGSLFNSDETPREQLVNTQQLFIDGQSAYQYSSEVRENENFQYDSETVYLRRSNDTTIIITAEIGLGEENTQRKEDVQQIIHALSIGEEPAERARMTDEELSAAIQEQISQNATEPEIQSEEEAIELFNTTTGVYFSMPDDWELPLDYEYTVAKYPFSLRLGRYDKFGASENISIGPNTLDISITRSDIDIEQSPYINALLDGDGSSLEMEAYPDFSPAIVLTNTEETTVAGYNGYKYTTKSREEEYPDDSIRTELTAEHDGVEYFIPLPDNTILTIYARTGLGAEKEIRKQELRTFIDSIVVQD